MQDGLRSHVAIFVKVSGYGATPYIGEVLKIDHDPESGTYQYQTKFLRPYQNREREYIFPQEDDVDIISTQQILKILDPPTIVRGRHIFPSV